MLIVNKMDVINLNFKVVNRLIIIVFIIHLISSCDNSRPVIDYSPGTTGHIAIFKFDTAKYELENIINSYLMNNPKSNAEKLFKDTSKLVISMTKIKETYGQEFFVYSPNYKKILWFGYIGTEKEWDENVHSSAIALVAVSNLDNVYKMNKELSDQMRQEIIDIAKTEFVFKISTIIENRRSSR